ncbi:MAG TPA: peptide-methionine (S)-S-oxide reductase MsrA [Methylomirabilota bacterium]|jgi:peptide-methionine (S)-S-oxide reductase
MPSPVTPRTSWRHTVRRWTAVAAALSLALGLGIGARAIGSGGEAAVPVPPPAVDNPKVSGSTQVAVLAGGCFWGVQGVYQHVRGVQQVLSGYSGGTRETADYETVSRGATRHAESVEIRFDPKEVSYGEILQIYFSVVHDPTQLDRQGPDVGPQYRSDIFYADETQKRIAEAYIAQLDRAKVFGRAIVTRVDPLDGFYPAEAYHQDFLIRNPTHPYIVVHDLPKLESLRKMFPGRYRERPITAGKSG